MKKYMHILAAIAFFIGLFGLSFLFVLFGFDAIVSTILSDIIIAIVGLSYMRYFFKQSGSRLTIGYAIFILFFLVMIWVFSQITATWFFDNIGDAAFAAYQKSIDVNLIGYLVLTLFVAPVSEEVLFRGILFNALKKAFPVGIAYVVSSVFFAAAHGTFIHMFIGFACGLLFVVIYQYTGKLWCNIITHMIYNALSVFASAIALPELLFNPYVFGTIDVLLCVLILLECIRVYKVQKPRLRLPVRIVTTMPVFTVDDGCDLSKLKSTVDSVV